METNAAEELERAQADIAPATVLAPNGRSAVVRFEDGESAVAALAVSDYEPRTGDRLLVARGRSGAWAIAVLSALREAPEPLRADDGASAQLEEGVLTVRDGEGRLLFEHRPDEGVSVVHAPHGDLRLSAPGSIELDAAREVRVTSRRVALEGKTVKLGAPARDGENALTLDRNGAQLDASTLEASAAVARLALLDTTFAAASVTTAIETARHVVGVAETRAERLVERVKNAYREVEELAQTRAGRIRQIAKGAFHITGERALIKADDDVSIKGEKIHLA